MLGSSLDDSTAYETQAIGRIRRMGQEETCVHVYRFYTRDTVEEKLHHAHLAY
jgi:SNF2 family DNA or RNA helicase